MRISDAEYYATRLENERRAVKKAGSAEARAAHQGMADLYADRLVKAVGDERTPALRVLADRIRSPFAF